MAIFPEVLDTYGWESEEVVVVQTPTFDVDPALDFGTFDWFSNDDATLLTNAVIERGLASGWDLVESNVTIPSIDSAEASLAATFAKLQTLFTDLLFGDCIDTDFNNTSSTAGNASGYLTWSTWANENEKSDAEWFEEFCTKAGLTDGGGNYGFRYIDSTGAVIYPNSTRKVTAGDVISTGVDTDIYLEDLLNALDRIEFVGWEKPGDSNRHGRKFAWDTTTGKIGAGDSVDSSDMYTWGGEASVEFAEAKFDFGEIPGAGLAPEGLATSKGELDISSASSEYTSSLTSDLTASDISFDADIAGLWVVQLKTAIPLSADSFNALGSSLSLGWQTPSTGGNAEDESVVTDVIGIAAMDLSLFLISGVPSFSLSVELNPLNSVGIELFDWFVGGTAKISGGTPPNEDIVGNPDGSSTWGGDLSELSPSEGEALNLSAGSYTGTFKYDIFLGSSSADSDENSASAEVSGTTTTTTTATTTTTTEAPTSTTFF